MKQRKTNVEFVTDLMEHSRYGALAHLFVLDALEKWATRVSKADPTNIGNGFVSGDAWVGVAKEIKQKIEERMA